MPIGKYGVSFNKCKGFVNLYNGSILLTQRRFDRKHSRKWHTEKLLKLRDQYIRNSNYPDLNDYYITIQLDI